MFFKIPSLVLKQLYTFGSLKNVGNGVQLGLKNRLSDATVTSIRRVAIDGVEAPVATLELLVADGERLRKWELRLRSMTAFNPSHPI